MRETKRPLKVFLCHASADKPKVRVLYRTLRRRGMQPWLDAEDLIPGQNWEEEIPKALHSSDAIIICLTPNSVDKEGYVQKEIKFALDKALEMPEGRIFLIPAKLEDCDLPFRLRQYQAVNLYEKEGYVKLMKALKLRASQLERNTIELPKERDISSEIKKVVEEMPESKPSVPTVDIGDRSINVDEPEETSSANAHENTIEIPNSKAKEIRTTWKPNIAILVALISLAGIIIAALLISPWFSPAPVFTGTPTVTITLTLQPTPTSRTTEPTPTPTEILAPVFTPVVFNDPHPDSSDHIDAVGIPMRLIRAGQFNMGSDNGKSDEKPVHPVDLDAYYIDKYEVTNGFYKACVEAGECQPPQNTTSISSYDLYGNPNYDNYPVMFISWGMAKTYCEWRGALLPTEAQWEKAARGTDERTYPWGNTIDQTFAHYDQSSGGLAAVGSYESGKSPYGVYDMSGNVSEWVEDWYSGTFYANSPTSNPSGPGAGQYRVYRGGTWYDDKDKVRASARYSYDPNKEVLTSFGFRCALSTNETVASGPTQTVTQVSNSTSMPASIIDDKGVQMVLVPASEFTMGSDNGRSDERPVHTIYVDTFYMDKFEVTNALYEVCVNTGACQPPVDSAYYNNVNFEDHPVAFINWYMAKAYCTWRGARLPTEAEWEKAAHGTDGTTYPWGETIDCSYANYRGENNYCVGNSSPVGGYESGKSSYGIFDLAGNVTEWVSSLNESYPYNANDGRENLNSASDRILRGGSWNNKDMLLRSADRGWNAPSETAFDYGFRCAKDANP